MSGGQTLADYEAWVAERKQTLGPLAGPIEPDPIGIAEERRPIAVREMRKRPSIEDIERDLRETYHMPLRVVDANDRGISFGVDKHWIYSIATVHEDLTRLLLLFFDVNALWSRGKMSTTALDNLLDIIVTNESINEDIYSIYSGRHFLIMTREVSLLDKTNWAREQTLKVRNGAKTYREWSTATQVDRLSSGLRRAMSRPTAPERVRAIEDLSREIYIDTRGRLGHPRRWLGFPVNPLPDSRAWFQKRYQDWTLWIERDGVPPDVLAGLHPLHLTPALLETIEPATWWATSEALHKT